MKLITILLLSAVCFTASAQKKSNQHLSESMHDDGKTLKIDITGDANGREINYHQKFNIKGMSTADKDALTQRITDSLGIKSSHRPPGAENAYSTNLIITPPSAPDAPGLKVRTKIHRDISTSMNDDGETMYLKFKGTANGNPIKFERIIDIKGKSAKEKDAIVKSITDSLGISDKVGITTSH